MHFDPRTAYKYYAAVGLGWVTLIRNNLDLNLPQIFSEDLTHTA